MRIVTTKLWKQPRILKIVLSNIFALDPSVLLHNPLMFLLMKEKECIACCALVRHGSCVELKTVYTAHTYRNKGYATRVLRTALKSQKEVYLICKQSLMPFYVRLRFKKIEEAPFPLAWRRSLYNIFRTPLIENKLIVMKKTY